MDTEYPTGLRRAALLIASMSSFLTPFMGSSVILSVPMIGAEFSMDAVSIGWIATAYLLAAAMFLVPIGKIADIHGRKKIFKYGIIIDAVASLLLAISVAAPWFSPWFISFRFLQGFGDAMIFGTSAAILIQVYPFKQRGRVLGISVAAVYTGSSVGPFVGGLLTATFGWRSVFIFILGLDFAIILALFAWLKGEWTGAKGEKLDKLGSAIYAFTIAAVIYGLTLLPSEQGFLLIGAGSLGLVAFIAQESRARNPVLDLELFRHNTVFAFSNLAALINYCATFAVTLLMSLYLQNVRGFTPFYAGLILVSQPIVQAIFSPLAGRTSDRVEPRIVSSAGMGAIVAGLYLLGGISAVTDLQLIVLLLMFLGLGFALFASPNANAIMSSVEGRLYGVASATMGTMRLIGQALSVGIAMLFFALIIGRVPITDPSYPALLVQSMQVLLITFAVLCFVGMLASLARGKVRARNPTGEVAETERFAKKQ